MNSTRILTARIDTIVKQIVSNEDPNPQIEIVDQSIESMNPSLKKIWEDFKRDLSFSIEFKKRAPTNVLALNEFIETNPSFEKSAKSLKEVWHNLSKEKKDPFKEWIESRKNEFLSDLQKKLPQRTPISLLHERIQSIWSYAAPFQLSISRVVGENLTPLVNRVFTHPVFFFLDPIYRLFQDNTYSPERPLNDTLLASEQSYESQRQRELENEKKWISQNKRKLNGLIHSLSESLSNLEYGEPLKKAALFLDPSVIAPSSFLKLLLIESTRNLNEDFCLLELDMPESFKEKIRSLTSKLKDNPFTSSELEALFLGEESLLSQKKQEMSKTLNEALQEIELLRLDELACVSLLHDALERGEKNCLLYKKAFLDLEKKYSPLEKASFLMTQMRGIGSFPEHLFLQAAEGILEQIQEIESPAREDLENELFALLYASLKTSLVISQESLIWAFLEKRAKSDSPSLEKNKCFLLLLPSLFFNKEGRFLDVAQEVLKSHKIPVWLFKMLLNRSPKDFELAAIAFQAASFVPQESRSICLIEFAETFEGVNPEIARDAAHRACELKFSEVLSKVNHPSLEAVAKIASKDLMRVSALLKDYLKEWVQKKIATETTHQGQFNLLFAAMIVFSLVDKQHSLDLGKKMVSVIKNIPELPLGLLLSAVLRESKVSTERGSITQKPQEIDKNFQDLFLEVLDLFLERQTKKDALEMMKGIGSFLKEMGQSKKFEEFGDFPFRVVTVLLKKIKGGSSERFEDFLEEMKLCEDVLNFLITISSKAHSNIALEIRESLETIQNELVNVYLKKIDTSKTPTQKLGFQIEAVRVLLRMKDKKKKALFLGSQMIETLKQIEASKARTDAVNCMFGLFAPLADQKSLRICMSLIAQVEGVYKPSLFWHLAILRPENREKLFKKGMKEMQKSSPKEQIEELTKLKEQESRFHPLIPLIDEEIANLSIGN